MGQIIRTKDKIIKLKEMGIGKMTIKVRGA